MKAKDCLIEVEAFPGNTEMGKDRKNAFVNVYLRPVPGMVLDEAIAEACEFMGMRLIEICSFKELPESEIPKEAVDGYTRRGAGFGVFHTFPP